MRGSIVKRSKTSWSFVFDRGRDPVTGKRKQTWIKFVPPRNVSAREAHKLAEVELTKLTNQVNEGTFIDTSKKTLLDYLREHQVKVAHKYRPGTVRNYTVLIDTYIAGDPIAMMPLQKLRALDLEAFYARLKRRRGDKEKKLSASTVHVLHAVISGALKTAARDRLIANNPATLVQHMPKRSKDKGTKARVNCLDAAQARDVLTAAKESGTQVSAFFAVLLDTGARRSEALGLTWDHIDLNEGVVTIAQQLTSSSLATPVFGPTKNSIVRTVTLNTETVARLRAHRKQQRESLMLNRTTYKDYGLVFCKEDGDLQHKRAALGQACPALADGHFRRVMKAAGIRRVTPHCTRHTCATLLLCAGLPVQVVAQRIGDSVEMVMKVYAHCMPSMEKEAAARLGALLAAGQ